MKNRIIKTGIFEDEAFLNLSCQAKNLALYLLYGPKISHLPIYRLPDRFLLASFSWDQKELDTYRKELESIGITYESFYWILDTEYTVFSYKSPKNDQTILGEVRDLPAIQQKRLLSIHDIDEKLGRPMKEFVNVPAGQTQAVETGAAASPSRPASGSPDVSLDRPHVNGKAKLEAPDLEPIKPTKHFCSKHKVFYTGDRCPEPGHATSKQPVVDIFKEGVK